MLYVCMFMSVYGYECVYACMFMSVYECMFMSVCIRLLVEHSPVLWAAIVCHIQPL